MFTLVKKNKKRTIQLNQWLTGQQIEELKIIFSKYPNRIIDFKEFISILSSYGINLEENEVDTLFRKISDSPETNQISWNEFIYYLNFELQTYDPVNKDELSLPITEPMKIKNSDHKTKIIGLTHNSQLINERPEKYVSISEDGSIIFWDLNMKEKKLFDSRSEFLKLDKKKVMGIQSLHKLEVLAVNLYEREIRFYDISESNYMYLLITISLPHVVHCMYYHFSTTKMISTLFLGDDSGCIRKIEFREKLKKYRNVLSWNDLIEGNIPNILVHEISTSHRKVIRKIFYWEELEQIYSASDHYTTSRSTPDYPGLIVTHDNGVQRIFNIPQGVTCFWIDKTYRILATGGPDAYMRLWNPFTSNKPLSILNGHQITICSIFTQTDKCFIYSVDLFKIIKVWNIKRQTLIQTFDELHNMFPKMELFSWCYNANVYEFIAGVGRKLISVKCSSKINFKETDGYTSTTIISVVLYNHRFENIVTCDNNSNILVWDVHTGNRQNYIKNAHTKKIRDKLITIKIKTACFNPNMKFLLTGAEDGSLKIWDYNVELRSKTQMAIQNPKEITAIFWLPNRILVMGHNKYVYEFADDRCKKFITRWDTTRNEEIVQAAICLPHCIATGSKIGHLVLWNLETGHGYRQFNVETKQLVRKDLNKSKPVEFRQNQIKSIIFLQTRPMEKNFGALFVSLSNGYIQVYSHHVKGTFIKEFKASHKRNDYILSMETDENNEFLFTGTTLGYIKTWLMTYYCTPEEEKQKDLISSYRLQFIFLIKNLFPGKAQFAIRNQLYPKLLNSYKGHLDAVTSLDYVQSAKILLSGSTDKTCRLWSLTGQYLTTIGTSLLWNKIENPLNSEIDQWRIPPDIQKVASTTTLRVLSNINIDRLKEIQQEIKKQKMKETSTVQDIDIDVGKFEYGKPLEEPILGKHFKLPERIKFTPPINLDSSLLHTPIYTHLNIYNVEPIERPKTPNVIKNVKKNEFKNDN